MSEVEDSWEYDSEISDLYQDRPTQGTVSSGSPIRQTRVKTYSHNAKNEKDKWINKSSECFEDHDTKLPKVRKPTRPLPFWWTLQPPDEAWRQPGLSVP